MMDDFRGEGSWSAREREELALAMEAGLVEDGFCRFWWEADADSHPRLGISDRSLLLST